MTDLERWINADHPIEWDCPGCGTHHVIEPDQVRALLHNPRFICLLCRHNHPTTAMTAYTVTPDGTVHGICANCTPEGHTP